MDVPRRPSGWPSADGPEAGLLSFVRPPVNGFSDRAVALPGRVLFDLLGVEQLRGDAAFAEAVPGFEERPVTRDAVVCLDACAIDLHRRSPCLRLFQARV